MEEDIKIQEMLKEGCSLRKIADALGLSFGTLRGRAIKKGLYTPTLRSVKNGKATCRSCKKSLPVSKFPGMIYGRYFCEDCCVTNNHKYQIRKVGCSVEMYESLLISQDGRCAICGRQFGHISKKNKLAKLAVDHDHETGRIRGLLCMTCNRGLGFLGENNLEKALAYIRVAKT